MSAEEAMNEPQRWCKDVLAAKDDGETKPCDCQGCETQTMGPWEVHSCPTCGVVADITWVDGSSSAPVSQTGNAGDAGNGASPESQGCPAPDVPESQGERMPPVFTRSGEPNVPWPTQYFLFEAKRVDALDDLSAIMWAQTEQIMELARERLAAGFAAYGSRMYGWTPDKRLRNVLEELADAVVYLTSGSVETEPRSDAE